MAIQFEDILPWGTTGGDTGLSSRLKLKRNFDRLNAWIDALTIPDPGPFTAWGQTFWQQGTPNSISGSLTDVADITMSGHLTAGGNVVATGAVSALGLSAAGSSGGALSLLSDVAISGTPQDGMVLTYDSVQGKWTAQGAQAPDLSGWRVKDVSVIDTNALVLNHEEVLYGAELLSDGTLKLYRTRLSISVPEYTSDLVNDSGFITSCSFDDLTSHPTTLSGYGITDAATSGQMTAATGRIGTLEGHFDASGAALKAVQLKTARTLWGQSFDGTANVSGNMTNVGRIALQQSSGSSAPCIFLDGDGINIYASGYNYALYVYGGDAYISERLNIEGFVIENDNDNLKFNGNVYATGAVSALGVSAAGSSGGALSLLTDVAIGGTPQDGMVLTYDSVQAKWTAQGAQAPDLSAYATRDWVTQQGYLTSYTEQFRGTVTQVKVGTTAYTPASGVVSLPAYPTTLPASDVYAWAKAATKPSYTLAEIGAVRNINDSATDFADVLKGYEGTFFFYGNNLVDGHYDWVGLQIGSSVDKGQIVFNGGSLKVRQNDSGGTNTSGWSDWQDVAFLTSNVASATKLQTPCAIWGRSFDGTGDVSGPMTGVTSIDALMYFASSNVGIGTTNPTEKLHVAGNIVATGAVSALGLSAAGSSGGALSLLTDVAISGTPQDGMVLTYDSVQGKWTAQGAQTPDLSGWRVKDVSVIDTNALVLNNEEVLYDAELLSDGTLKLYRTRLSIYVPEYTSDLTNDSGFITANDAVSALTPKAVGSSSALESTAGTFAFSGADYLRSGYDYVGLQVGDSLDKWQLTAIGSLQWRQNDSGGTNAANWSSWRTLIDTQNWSTHINMSSLGVTSALESYLPLTAGSGKPLTGSLWIDGTGKGLIVKDSTGSYFTAIGDNGTNLWIGAYSTASYHHRGNTCISAGHNGTTGNATIYVSVPNAANNGGTNYGVWHSGNFTPSNYLPLTGGTLTGNLNVAISGGNTNSDSAKIEFRTFAGNTDYVYGPYIQAINVDTYGRKRLSVFQKANADWTTAQTEVLSILPSGDVGIGTPVPSHKLDVIGDARLTEHLYFTGVDNVIYFDGRDGLSATGDTLYLGYGFCGGQVYRTEVYGYGIGLFTDTTRTERLTILPSGNVGIGTTTPSELLHIYNGKLRIGGAVVEWDSTNQMLKFSGGKGIYAMGAVSALGIAGDLDGQVTRPMTFTEAVAFSSDVAIGGAVSANLTIGQYTQKVNNVNQTQSYKLCFGDSSHYIYKDTSGRLHIQGAVYTDSALTVASTATINTIDVAGRSEFCDDMMLDGKLIFGTGANDDCIYVDNGHLYFRPAGGSAQLIK